ncbi:hypothetical protein A33Q_2246 [Indibacter alkaliphilus LW1]|uniref:Uncharacterized protein n=1 Tax=Indibacter alkaliphilus (strain CCUG 57479 / KCTC 22604 / LW1) TaxID=1189612 RepID=S2DWL4_INDAL|nr:hypothetical protein [Indibacter alkaliphilus]EOZ96476.1 hypothetical protein A33Q_2246 [Indibacter alkaliphilus LW1]
MKKKIQTIDEKKFFKLPLEKGTFCLSKEILNAHSKFGKLIDYFQVETTELSFRNEILTLSVKLPGEPKKLVYLKVTEKELLVSCSFDTDFSYLSRYVYIALREFMGISGKAYFDKYYWPDFFDPKTGRSKYLQIINDRRGFDIKLKSKYPSFYKPGYPLLELQDDLEIPKDEIQPRSLAENLPITDKAIGFALADTILSSFHSNHYPFLVPLHGVTSKDREKIKTFATFHLNEDDGNELVLSQDQKELSKICFKMRELAPVSNSSWDDTFVPTSEELEKGKQLFKLWHQAYKLLLTQKYVYFFHTRGLKYVKGKPMRSWMRPCEFKKETPELVIKRMDKGDYFQIELAFRIKRKLNRLHYPNLTFFLRPETNWLEEYLLGSFNDWLVVSFFEKTKYKLAVLKSHYKGDFEDFINQLAERYEVIDS